ncbi:hypothetical protein AWB76_03314 [Caballeronia temeraria]|uniref:Uncharacterized protein n=1 Tax=Caballeronia temeraria TaxID=1777137 RepID=A0A158AZU6_9BURK|nr:hypothetical protein AWB76_03314 [Caballeronia temeraria]
MSKFRTRVESGNASARPACLDAGGGLLRGFLESEIEKDIDFARGQLGRVDIA